MILQTKLNVLVRQFLIGSFSALILIGCGQKKGGYTAQDEGESVVAIPDSVDFSLHIKPILSDRCFACHGPDKNAIEGGLSLHKAEDAYAAIGENKDRYAIVPGDLIALGS